MAIRTDPDLVDALKIAAAEDGRSIASYVGRVLREHLVIKEFLPKPDRT